MQRYSFGKDNTIPAVSLILSHNNQVLFMQRAGTDYYPGWFALPAGHVDAGESVREAMQREAREELGVILNPIELQVVHVMSLRSDLDGSRRVNFFLVAHNWHDEPRICEQHKCSELRWCDVEALPDNTVPYVKSALRSIHQGDRYSEFGWDTIS